MYNYRSDVKVLSCQLWGCLASMCEATSPPPCELTEKTVNKPLVVDIHQGAWPAHRPLPRPLDITHPPAGPLKVRSGLQLQSAAVEDSRTDRDKRRQDESRWSLSYRRSCSSVSARACPVRRAANPERRLAPTTTEPQSRRHVPDPEPRPPVRLRQPAAGAAVRPRAGTRLPLTFSSFSSSWRIRGVTTRVGFSSWTLNKVQKSDVETLSVDLCRLFIFIRNVPLKRGIRSLLLTCISDAGINHLIRRFVDHHRCSYKVKKPFGPLSLTVPLSALVCEDAGVLVFK